MALPRGTPQGQLWEVVEELRTAYARLGELKGESRQLRAVGQLHEQVTETDEGAG